MMRATVARWYLERPVAQLAMHITKYQQRNGWSHRDLLRLCHVHPNKYSMTQEQKDHQLELEHVLHYAVAGEVMPANKLEEVADQPMAEDGAPPKKKKIHKPSNYQPLAVTNCEKSKALAILNGFTEIKKLTAGRAEGSGVDQRQRSRARTCADTAA